ncbi:transposase [Ruegeria atlantica]|uniref:transposase n=1 Tax=Ruegeria atlantica TaxID=81569 RepID=UPI003D7CDE6F
MPPGDADYSTRWRLIKSRFVWGVGAFGPRSGSKVVKQERGIWQRRFWEHWIRDVRDYRNHMAYCRVSPVKHGFVNHPTHAPCSSMHRDVRAGRVDLE